MARLFLILFSISVLGGAFAQANPLVGKKTLSFLTPDGEKTAGAQVEFRADGDGYRFGITWHDNRFTDHFLSMRPFRCMEGPVKNWCYVPYPYENRRKVTEDDLTDLEYDLLFLSKNATDYGINLWNGIYYKLEIDGDRIIGQLHEMDMNILAAPPPAGELRPVKAKDLHEAEPESHWLPMIVIE